MVKLYIIIRLIVPVILILLLVHISIFSKILAVRLSLKENLVIKYFTLIGKIKQNRLIKNTKIKVNKIF